MHRLQRLTENPTSEEIAATFRRESPAVVATLTRVLGDLDLAEDAVQDAFVAAMERWPVHGLPDRPGAWIVTTARNKAIDRLRREAKREEKHQAAHRSLASLDGWDAPDSSVLADDLLRLIFTCCHPAVPVESRVALALKTLCGLRTADVARLLVSSESATAQRIVRAKRQLADPDIPFAVPAAHELPERLPAVLSTIHLVFTEGHNSVAAASHVRPELCAEAIRLARLLDELMPDEPEVAGLHALLLLTDARRATRVDASGDLVRLADQNRSRWDRDAIDAAVELLESALRRGRAGRYQLEAAIAASHATAPTYADTDWDEIVDLFGLLEHVAPSPTLTLNRAVAVGEARGAAAGLATLAELAGALDDHHLRWAVEADLLDRLDRTVDAAAALQRALACDPNPVERRHLQRRLRATRRR